MNSVMLQQVEARSDADLVARCIEDDREAFGEVVERYQNLLCGLAYSVCGDVGRSEDLAQETFLVAWRKLAQLQDPGKLKSWLCGILRNLARNSARARIRDPLGEASALEEELASAPGDFTPRDRLMSTEEKALLWKLVQGLPEIYREPLILFYRSGNSSADVAEALDLSEDAVRQRLARGRSLLGERVTRLVESGLRRSAPTKVFTVSVLAALPVLSASAATGATTLAAGQAGTAFKGAGLLAKVLASVVSLVGVGAGLLGLWGHILNTRSRRERRFVVWALGVVLVWSTTLCVVPALFFTGYLVAGGEWSEAILLCLGWLALAAPLDAYVIWMALRQKQIRARDQSHPDFPRDTAKRGFRLSMWGVMTALAFGTTGWLMVLAARHEDIFVLVLLLLGAATASIAGAVFAVNRPAVCARVFAYQLWFLAAVNITTVGLRWTHWVSVAGNGNANAGPLLLMIAVFFGSIRAGWVLKQRFLGTTTFGRDILVAAGVFAIVMLFGLAFLRGVRQWERPEIKDVQVVLNDVHSDGSIRFRLLYWGLNQSGAELRELQFVNSPPALEKIFDAKHHPLPFTSRPEGEVLRYSVPLSTPVPPGGWVAIRSEGQLPTRATPLGDGLWQIQEKHWPANGLYTLRVERYRLPAGAKSPTANLPVGVSRRFADGRLEARFHKVIRPGDSMQVRLNFELSR
jgi:RNA polymerase sigma factor (sigma-70 family)